MGWKKLDPLASQEMLVSRKRERVRWREPREQARSRWTWEKERERVRRWKVPQGSEGAGPGS